MKRIPTLVLVFAALAFFSCGLFADTIKRTPPMENVDVIKETYKKITYRLGQIQQEMDRKRDRVQGVEYDTWPESWDTGHAALKGSDFASAIADFEDVARSASEDMPQARQYGLFYKAEAERKWAEAGNGSMFAKALATYNALIQAEPETVFLAKAYIGMGRCHVFLGNKAEALARFDAALTDDYFSDSDKIAAKIGKAYISELEKKFRVALAEYQAILTEAEKTAPAEAPQVKVRIGLCKLGLEQYDQAMSDFNRILSDSSIPAGIRSEVRAAAYNGRGECFWKKREYEKGMMDFVRVLVLYESITSESPKAFHFAAGCMANMATALEKAGKKDDGRAWRMRSRSLTTELKEKFPGSEWAQK